MISDNNMKNIWERLEGKNFLEKYPFLPFPYSILLKCVWAFVSWRNTFSSVFPSPTYHNVWHLLISMMPMAPNSLASGYFLFLLEGVFLAVQDSSIGDIVTTDKDKDKDENKVALADPF